MDNGKWRYKSLRICFDDKVTTSLLLGGEPRGLRIERGSLASPFMHRRPRKPAAGITPLASIGCAPAGGACPSGSSATAVHGRCRRRRGRCLHSKKSVRIPSLIFHFPLSTFHSSKQQFAEGTEQLCLYYTPPMRPVMAPADIRCTAGDREPHPPRWWGSGPQAG